MCKEKDCNEKTFYNYKSEIKGEYCKLHKKEGMIDIREKSRICLEKECTTRSIYNYKGETKVLYCFKHKKENMINIKDKKCEEEGCEIIPNYNYKEETKGLYCLEHKKECMINVINKKCAKDGCMFQSSYNYEGEKKRLYCSKHKEEGMINIASKICQKKGCKTTAIYNYEGKKKRLYCSEHKEEGMIDLIHPKCLSEWCYAVVYNERCKGYCLFCFIHLFPNEPVTKNYKTKEKATVDFILEIFHDFTWRTDKKVQDGCSLRRPDLLLDLGYQVVIIEIDENQHENYDSSCENKRIMEISKDVDHRPIVFIRFNPDDYLKDDKNITSCWAPNKQGICTVKKSKKKEWAERLSVLKEQVEYWSDEKHKSGKTVNIIQLFYDQ